jgi:hypothetical protein|eukprot:scaffold896_cov233-Chaetoceros_neogracile.AAC.5
MKPTTSRHAEKQRGGNNNNQEAQRGNYNVNPMVNQMGNLSESLAGLSVGNYGVTSSSSTGNTGPVSQDQNPHGNLSILNESIGMGWDSGSNIS